MVSLLDFWLYIYAAGWSENIYAQGVMTYFSNYKFNGFKARILFDFNSAFELSSSENLQHNYDKKW